MADLSGIQQTLDRLLIDLKARDEGLRQAFGIVTDGLIRMQAVMDDIHAAATKDHPPSAVPALLAEIKMILEAQPAHVARAIRDVLDAR